MTKAKTGIVVLLAATGLGCTGSGGGTPSDGGSDQDLGASSCADLQAQWRTIVAGLDNSCTSDSDCAAAGGTGTSAIQVAREHMMTAIEEILTGHSDVETAMKKAKAKTDFALAREAKAHHAEPDAHAK